MRIGLFIAALICLAPCLAKAQTCAQKKPAPAKINIELELPEPVYDLKRSIDEINKGASADDWLKRNGMEKVWKSSNMVRLGYAEGGMAMMTSSQYRAVHLDRYGVYYCPYVTGLDLAMIFRTRIVIPDDFKKGGCRFNAVHDHEYRHYQANRDVADIFVRRLYKDLPVIIREVETRIGHVERGKAQQTMESMKLALDDAIKSYILQSMVEEGRRRNNQIDTPEEYAAAGPIMAACKD